LLLPIGIIGILYGLFQYNWLKNNTTLEQDDHDLGNEMQEIKSGSPKNSEKKGLLNKHNVLGNVLDKAEHMAENLVDDAKDMVSDMTGGNHGLVKEQPKEIVYKVEFITALIAKGARSFLYQEYKYCTVFIILMSVTLAVSVDKMGTFWTTTAFAAGAITSIISGYIGMIVAVYANGRVAIQASHPKTGLTDGFRAAFRAGAVMGFCLTSLGLIVLLIILYVYNKMYPGITVAEGATLEELELSKEAFMQMYESIAGYGLGGSSIALFGRVGGGIYTKAADVGADLVGKVEQSMNEDSPRNPGTIADNVGDNVGDVAGMGADLFGSFAESSSATLVVAATIPEFYQARAAMYFPVAITGFGILVCLLTSLIATGATIDEHV